MAENHFFAEKELCSGRIDDRSWRREQQRARKAHEPSSWQRKAPALTTVETSVVVRNGVVATVMAERADAWHGGAVDAPFVEEESLRHLRRLSAAERRALLSGEPPLPPPAAAAALPAREHAERPTAPAVPSVWGSAFDPSTFQWGYAADARAAGSGARGPVVYAGAPPPRKRRRPAAGAAAARSIDTSRLSFDVT